MEDKLIKQLQEADIFTPVSKKDVAHRDATRPPRILQGDELNVALSMLLASVVADLGQSELMEYLVDGTPVLPKPICRMTVQEMVKELIQWEPVTRRDGKGYAHNPNLDIKEWLLKMMSVYQGDKYDGIEGI